MFLNCWRRRNKEKNRFNFLSSLA